MKLIVALFMALMAGTSWAASCMVYLPEACFSLREVESVGISLPADFTLYSVVMENSSALIYSGGHPKDFQGQEGLVKCSGEGAYKCKMAIKNNVVHVLFQPDDHALAMHIQVTTKNGSVEGVKRFLDGFRRCVREGEGMKCNDEKLFDVTLPANKPG